MISVGIDVGNYSIKVAEVESTSRSYVVRRILEIPLNQDPTRDRRIEIIDALRTLLEPYGADTQFVFAIPQKYISSRFLKFPFSERFKVQKAIFSQLEDEIPLTMEEAVFESKIVRVVGKGAEVLALATPKEHALARLNFSHDCGVETKVITGEGLALANHFEDWLNPPPEVAAIVQEIPSPRPAEVILNIGHSSTIALVYVEGILHSIRHVDWGAKALVESVVQKYGLNPLQALREVQSKGGVLLDKTQGTKDQVAFSEAFETRLNHFASELRLLLLEIQSEFNVQWTKGSLLGGGAKFKNLGAFLTQALQIPFNRANVVEKHPSVFTDLTPQLEAVSAIAVGLALEGLRRPRNPASNFLKGDLAKPSQAFENLWNIWGHTARLLAIGFVIFVVYAMMRESLSLSLLEASDQVLRVQAEAIAKIKGRPPSTSKIKQFIRGQEQIEKSRIQAEGVVRMNSALDVLNLIDQNLPKRGPSGFEIKRVSILNEIAEVHGYAASAVESKNIRNALARAAANGNVQQIGTRIPVPAGKQGFAYRFSVRRKAGG